MSVNTLQRIRSAVKRRAAASEAILEAVEIHANLGTPCALIEQQDPWLPDKERQLLDTLVPSKRHPKKKGD